MSKKNNIRHKVTQIWQLKLKKIRELVRFSPAFLVFLANTVPFVAYLFSLNQNVEGIEGM